MKKIKMIILISALSILISGCSYTKTGIDNYLDTGSELDQDSLYVMPVLDDIENYESIEYLHTHKDMILFEADSVVLDITYDEETYKNEKELIDEKYMFYIKEEDENNSIMQVVEDEFSINSYEFRIVVKNEENFTGLPKSFGMIGTSDENKSIAYLYFYDFDLDSIGAETVNDVMPDFIRDYFKYEFE